MSDEHQINSIIATAICDSFKDHSEAGCETYNRGEAQTAYEGLCRGRAKALVSFGIIVMIHRGPASSFTDLITPTYFEPRKVMAVGCT